MTDDIDKLQDKIDTLKAAENKAADTERENRQMSIGMQAGSEFSAYVISGVISGFLLDRWLDTTPLMLAIMLFTGFGYGIYRAAKIMK